ncbi:MAG: hypothetical protein JWR23_1138 [Mucilaginibacter sp.]|nr:hypothetical protein [Mucilaginibacter sp.]
MTLDFQKLFRINLNKEGLIRKQPSQQTSSRQFSVTYPAAIVTVITLKKVM